jgi:hypothetical protein
VASNTFVLENPAAEYFEEAVEAFLDLARPTQAGETRGPVEYLNRRLRLCTLLSALAAEAYVNAFMVEALGAAQAMAVDREPTTAKYVLGTERVAGKRVLDRGQGPLQLVVDLFKQRDSIVHARPRRVKVNAYGLRIEPTLCARWLIAVADCVLVLNECLGETEYMGPVESMHDLGDEIDVDWSEIETERDYFFTGGLIHVVAQQRKAISKLGDAVERNPFLAATERPPDLPAEGRELEGALLIGPAR